MNDETMKIKLTTITATAKAEHNLEIYFEFKVDKERNYIKPLYFGRNIEIFFEIYLS